MKHHILYLCLALGGAIGILAAEESEKSVKSAGKKKEDPKEGREGKANEEKDKKKNHPPIDPSLGILEGRVFLAGEPPQTKEIEVPPNNQDAGFCMQHVKSEQLILDDEKAVKNVVISVGGYEGRRVPRPAPREPKVDNKNCLFAPHVQATTVGSVLEMHNSDKFIHNCRGLFRPLRGINVALGPNEVKEKKLRYPGWGVMKCDFHPWMEAHVHVFTHDLFAVSESDGTFKIVNIPPGTHEIEIWHEKLAPYKKTQKREVKVEAGETTKIEIRLEALK